MPRIAKTNSKTTAKAKSTKVNTNKTTASSKTEVQEVVNETVNDTVEDNTATVASSSDFTIKQNVTPTVRIKHDPEELIPCRSVTRGELNYLSRKSGTLYVWADYGDVTEVQYQDLFPLIITKSAFVFNPFFVVEDADLVDEWWDKIGELYTKIYNYNDIDSILRQSPTEFRNSLLNMPKGIREAVKTSVATKIDDGTFDSLQKIKIVDEIMGTDLKCLVS